MLYPRSKTPKQGSAPQALPAAPQKKAHQSAGSQKREVQRKREDKTENSFSSEKSQKDKPMLKYLKRKMPSFYFRVEQKQAEARLCHESTLRVRASASQIPYTRNRGF
ncbi:MAG: hypothetical protein IJ558_13460 [Treponema sp.]|nr:hypothetical protein [Treponema sp.]